MKNKIFLLFFFCLLFSFSLTAQIEKVIVETYYVSDTSDATDTTQGRSIALGAKTFRIYIDLKRGYRLNKIYGAPKHPLKIFSTQPFYNNIDRPTAYFGYQINKSWFTNNPTLGLDSWLTLGLATKTHVGVLKKEDSDGSIIGGSHNTGGTAGVTGGLLTNNVIDEGDPLTTVDGMLPLTYTLGTWLDNGFRNSNSGGIDTTIFGSTNIGSFFSSTSAFLQQNSGVTGNTLDSNKVLIAQLTTTGEISFELNLQLLDSLGHTINCIANNNGNIPQGDTIVSSSLKYPPLCGCTDPHFLEYGAEYLCSNVDSCRTKIVFGCTDTAACNYNPNANFHIQYMCCYPGYCYNRDISLVCPSISNEANFTLFPNPTHDNISLQLSTSDYGPAKYEIYDSFGAIKIQKNMGVFSGTYNEQIDLSNLPLGLYLVRLYTGSKYQSKTFTKN